ncbi:MAG: glycosyltransferase [Pirellula sp.]|jgi:hypothetical protein
MMKNTSGLFVSNKIHLAATPGGVQWCTAEYISTLNEVVNLESLGYRTSRSVLHKLSRRLFPTPYGGRFDQKTIRDICQAIDDHQAEFVFLNNTEALSLAPIISSLRPKCNLVYLSHGVELTDVVNNLRLASETMPLAQKRTKWLGQLLVDEIRQRECLFGTVCISQEDVLFEQWLGSSKVLFLPRMIVPDPIDRNPVDQRVGCVATLNHGPNLHGLKLLLEELNQLQNVRLRLVGGPIEIGKSLASKYSFLDYLGPLNNEELKKEATSWWAFVNPIFCVARGASTKVATALGWGVPVLTTPHGKRGYNWPQTVEVFKTPRRLAHACCNAMASEGSYANNKSVEVLLAESPDIRYLRSSFLEFLNCQLSV